jgi:hypothetical protein
MEVVEIFLSNPWLFHPSKPMRIENDLPSNGPPMEFRMKILVSNETLRGFHPLIK